jgi:hypothetical protein
MTVLVVTSVEDLPSCRAHADADAGDAERQALRGGEMADPTCVGVRSGRYVDNGDGVAWPRR